LKKNWASLSQPLQPLLDEDVPVEPHNRFSRVVSKINDWIAIRSTLVFGSMWLTYAFFLYGFLPIVFPSEQVTILYWSNTIQLWALPLLLVGTNLLGRAAEIRAKQDHQILLAQFEDLKQRHKDFQEEQRLLRAIIEKLEKRVR